MPPAVEPSELDNSPLYQLAVLVAARKSKDRTLERVTLRRLKRLGVNITFGDDIPKLPTTTTGKAVARG